MPGWIEIAVVLIILILLFGRGKISDLMGDVAKGITSFKKGLKEDEKVIEAPGREADAALGAGQGDNAESGGNAEQGDKEKNAP